MTAYRIFIRSLLIALVAIYYQGAIAKGAEHLPKWLSSSDPVFVGPLRGRQGTFQNVTSVGMGEDLALGFVSFFLWDSKWVAFSREKVATLNAFMRESNEVPKSIPLAGTRASFLMFVEAKPSEQIIVNISNVRPWVSVTTAHQVAEGVYQADTKGEIEAVGQSDQIWKFLDELAREFGTIAAPVEKK